MSCLIDLKISSSLELLFEPIVIGFCSCKLDFVLLLRDLSVCNTDFVLLLRDLSVCAGPFSFSLGALIFPLLKSFLLLILIISPPSKSSDFAKCFCFGIRASSERMCLH